MDESELSVVGNLGKCRAACAGVDSGRAGQRRPCRVGIGVAAAQPHTGWIDLVRRRQPPLITEGHVRSERAVVAVAPHDPGFVVDGCSGGEHAWRRVQVGDYDVTGVGVAGNVETQSNGGKVHGAGGGNGLCFAHARCHLGAVHPFVARIHVRERAVVAVGSRVERRRARAIVELPVALESRLIASQGQVHALADLLRSSRHAPDPHLV